jgi:hypothetical protein
MRDGRMGSGAAESLAKARPARCRPFTVADAMILVGATALSFSYLHRTGSGYDFFRREIVRDAPVSGLLTGGCWIASALLATWTLAFLLLRFRPPRPGRRRLSRQPGLIACASATLSMMATATYYLVEGTSRPNSFHLSWNHLLGTTSHCGLPVIAAWGVQLYGRTWQSEPGWIDGVGMTLGALWIVEYVVNLSSDVLRTISW